MFLQEVEPNWRKNNQDELLILKALHGNFADFKVEREDEHVLTASDATASVVPMAQHLPPGIRKTVS